MAGSSMGGIVKVGLIGAGGFLLYRYFAPSLFGAAPLAVAPAVNTPAGAGTPSTISFNTLDAIYSRLSKAVGGTPYSVDQFNWYLQSELPAGKTAPDPDTFMATGYDRAGTMTLSQYWGAVTPKLKSELGLSGLGVFGGLGSLMLTRRYW